jgi:alpha-glucosidase
MIISVRQESSWSKKIIYQIYPRSFKDSNNDGIGDIRGIIQKLDYLAGDKDSLNIDAIWISPIYISPMKDFGYDVSDYCDIDPIFGTLEDFDDLVKEAHKRGIKILMDFIPNHTSIEHSWFLESKSSTTNPKRDWYIWKKGNDEGGPPNNWISVFGGSMWEYDSTTQEYYLHSFLKEQPDLNWRNPEVQKAMFDVLRFWLKRGVDGFRVDAFSHLYKDSEFRDEPKSPENKTSDPYFDLEHIYIIDQPEILEIMPKLESVLKEFGNDKFMNTENEALCSFEMLIKLYQSGSVNHAPFNFNFIFFDWDPRIYKLFIDRFDVELGQGYSPTYVLGNHDRARVASRIGKESARTAALLQLTLRGIPTIYYGDEIGMEDLSIPADLVQDPFERNIPGKGLGRDPERTPMQWNDSKNAGFSDLTPWLPVNPDYKTKNVSSELSDDSSMLSFYRSLIAFRRTSRALLSGIYRPLDAPIDGILMYMREEGDEKLCVILNFTDKPRALNLPAKKYEVIINTCMNDIGNKVENSELSLDPREGYLCRLM